MPRIFISHSHEDATLAGAFANCLEHVFDLESKDILCTSVPKNSFPNGTKISAAIKEALSEAEVLIGLVTPDSLVSSYVMFELGAAWWDEKSVLTLVHPKVALTCLGPLQELNLGVVRDQSQIHDKLHDLFQQTKKGLGIRRQLPELAREIRALENVVADRFFRVAP